MEDYNFALCQEKHKEIDRRLEDVDKRENKMEKKLDWILGLVAALLITTVGALIK